MKSLFYLTSLILIVFAGNKARAQANTTLSNLATPTSINTDLLPNANGTRSLGSATRTWNNIFAHMGYYIDGNRIIHSLGGNSATPNSNIFVGVNAGNINASNTGSFNVAVGYEAMLFNSTGTYNAATGAYSLFHNGPGGSNTAIGHTALYNNFNGNRNTATGQGALYANMGGSDNSAVGQGALALNIGSANTAVGSSALFNNSGGIWNTAVGYLALAGNSSASYSTAMGVNALRFGNGSQNCAFGVNTLPFNSGAQNIAIGNGALYDNSSGSNNTSAGYLALGNTTTSWYNTSVGFQAGYAYNNGYNNVFLGAETDVNGPGYYNVVAIGHGTLCTANSQARIGNSYTTSIGGYANWSNISDVRVKKNIQQNVPGLVFINKLHPITYNLDLEAADKIMQAAPRKDQEGKLVQPSPQESSARAAKEQVVYTGFAAQDVEKVAKSLNYNFSGVDAAKNDKDLYGLRYAEFVVPLVKAVQELSLQNDTLRQRLQKLEAMMGQLSSVKDNNLQTEISAASLEQNTPNPFNNATIINYALPQQYSSAKIIVTDKAGRLLKEMNVSGAGKGTLHVDASTLSSGAYQYSLIVNGKMIDTKQMMLAK